jgi:cytochrome b subunit of formate dehydrogenase
MGQSSHPGALDSDAGTTVVRHQLLDRFLHWFIAACMLTLLGTSLLPIFGIKFAWVQPHWITGLLLVVAVLIHITRSMIWKNPLTMWFGIRDLRDILQTIRYDLFRHGNAKVKPGKYSPAQKLLHYAMTFIILTGIITGLIMMVKIDTPLWERNPYWLKEKTWGIVYLVHGLAALCSITMIMIHTYFALRPEKYMYTRSMLLGWISREEYSSYHDSERWKITDK